MGIEFDQNFNTILTPEQEQQFQVWKAEYAPNDSGIDYDLRGAFLSGLKPGENGHWSDEFKKPNHPTFSTQSKYAPYAPEKAGHWIGDTFLPPGDKRPYNTLYGEVGGGSPDEVAATASVYLNRIKQQGLENALKGSAAYNKRSPEYMKAVTGNMTPYEKAIYQRNNTIMDKLINDPSQIQPYDYQENVKAFGEPSWAPTMASYKDVGRQRFYTSPQLLRAQKVGKK